MTSHADARVEELQLLASIDRAPRLQFACYRDADAAQLRRRGIVLSLLREDYVNDMDTMSWDHDPNVWSNTKTGVDDPLSHRLRRSRADALDRLLTGQSIDLQLSHRGRVRMAQLRDELHRDRLRDAFGILLDQRHVTRDLAVALTSASSASPVSLATFDVNGLKAVNDIKGHDAGDELIRTYLSAIAECAGPAVDAYRCGGDEAVLVATHLAETELEQVAETILRRLATEKVMVNGVNIGPVCAACGLASTCEPESAPMELLKRADENMRTAKAYSKKHNSESAIATSTASLRLIGSQ